MLNTTARLGVRPGEHFMVHGYPGYYYRIGTDGQGLIRSDGYNEALENSYVLMKLYERPELIIRNKETNVGEQQLLLTMNKAIGLKWAAVDADGTIGFFSSKPVKGLAQWVNGEDHGGPLAIIVGFHTSIATWDDDEPLDIEFALAALGHEGVNSADNKHQGGNT